MSNIAIRAEHVSKQYRLGAIGGGTLKGDVQSLMARIQHKEDPNMKIGMGQQGRKNERFMALTDLNFEIEQGEVVGIIGHNGAGKSTLLKLLSRVTAPSEGMIGINGRIASMLEVGTGFHNELTGRENVYMNGAILGMTKAEVTKKFDQIVKFAEMEQFIDTPVKRYSSGMYVKLAFAVAAHLDSEIMIMDEVLAVGDMKFQQKCLGKMDDASKSEGRTVLYVSHNMNTIRQLCQRCIVLDHGKIIFDGDTNDAINIYLNNTARLSKFIDYSDYPVKDIYSRKVKMISNTIENSDTCVFDNGGKIKCTLKYVSSIDADNIRMRVEYFTETNNILGVAFSEQFEVKASTDIKEKSIDIDISPLSIGKYHLQFAFYQSDENGMSTTIDLITPAMRFEVKGKYDAHRIIWQPQNAGNIIFNDVELI